MRLYMGDIAEMPLRFNYLYMRMYKILRHLFERLVAEFSDSDFEPCDFDAKAFKERIMNELVKNINSSKKIRIM